MNTIEWSQIRKICIQFEPETKKERIEGCWPIERKNECFSHEKREIYFHTSLKPSLKTGLLAIDTNACNKQTGGDLRQHESKIIQTLLHDYSPARTKEEKIYDKNRREFLPIVYTVNLLRKYLERTQFRARTHQDNLR